MTEQSMAAAHAEENPTQPPQQEMCCDGKQTAEEHRHNSPDGKCCVDK
jgi:hypothetical protein